MKIKKLFFSKTFKFFIVLAVPFVFALPWPPPIFDLHIKQIVVGLKNGESVKQEKFRFLVDNKALGAPLLSRVLSIETDSMPGYICLTNTSKNFSEGTLIEKDKLMDKEGGVISVPLSIDNSVTQIIDIPFASTTCQFVKGSVEFGNNVGVRGFLPFGNPELVMSNGEPFISITGYSDLVTVFELEGEKGYNWRWVIFLKNLGLFLIGWMILFSSGFQVFYWIYPRRDLTLPS